MILTFKCVKICFKLCILLRFIYSSGANCLILNSFKSDSIKLSPFGVFKNGHSLRKKDSLSYINKDNSSYYLFPRIMTKVSSQKHLLEKERYIRRKGPSGFQTIEVKKDPNISNKTLEMKEKLKKIFPNSDIADIWNNFMYSGSIKKGTLSGRQLPAKNIRRPNYYKTGKPIYVKYPNCDRGEDDPRGTVKTESEIEGIRKACRIAREILDFVSQIVVEGIFTEDIDRYVHRLCAIKKVFPATLNYHGFPKSVCTSINEVACHGIPDNNVLAAGDLLKVDLSVYCDGYFGDLCETFMVMPVNENFNNKLIENTMGRYERNKLIYRSIKHNNMEGCYRSIVCQNLLIKTINHAIKFLSQENGYFKFLKTIFNQDYSLRFKFDQDEEWLKMVVRLCQSIRKIYIEFDSPYEGRIVGLPSSLLPSRVLDETQTHGAFITYEDPYLALKQLDLNDANRHKKPYTFSHTFKDDVELMKITHEALEKAISICKPGVKISNIGKTIQKYLKSKGCTTISGLCGHGIGRNFHEEPLIPNEETDSNIVMEPGMVFTIEPVVTRSTNNSFMMWPDGWTLTTIDGSKTAQYEHTVLITKDGHEVLTKKLPSSPPYFWERPMEIEY